MKVKNRFISVFLVLFSLQLLSACTTRLAPSHDAQLYHDIRQTNIKIMTLFAAVSMGSTSASFSQREPLYNELIGTLDALAIQSKARPVPENAISEKINQILTKRGMSVINDGSPPSAEALNAISKQLTKMKQTDAQKDLKPLLVATFKNAVIISMDQALTYESFLNR